MRNNGHHIFADFRTTNAVVVEASRPRDPLNDSLKVSSAGDFSMIFFGLRTGM